MIIEDFKHSKKNIFKSKGFYIALLLCVTAAGIGTWGALKTPFNSSINDDQSTIDWYNQGVTIVTEGEKANVPATGVPDDRSSTEQESQTKETTAKAVTEPDENTPYKGYYALPLGTDILKDYSNGEMVKSKTMGDWRVHNGVDFSGAKGNEVLSIQDGKVTAVYKDSLWGTIVEIDHGKGLIAKYCGLNNGSTPKKGSSIKQFDTIGTLGDIPIESADGYHLHLEITVDGKTVDPLAAMNKIGA